MPSPFLALWRSRALLLAPAGLVVMLACNTDEKIDDDNFREDVISCEDALAKLEGCCPGFRANAVRCQYYERTYEHSGCDSSTYEHQHEDPALRLADSQCILGRSCSELVNTGVCAKAQAAKPYLVSTYRHEDHENPSVSPNHGTTQYPTAVCP
jgi:hypothetical protein